MLTSQNATYVVSDLVPHRVPVVTPLVIIRNVLETHFAEVFVRPGGRDELIRGISADKTRPETLEVQASIIEGGFEWRDSEVDFGSGRGGHSVRRREEGADFVIPVVGTIQGLAELLGLHLAIGVECRAVDPRLEVLHRGIRKSQSYNEKTRTLAFEESGIITAAKAHRRETETDCCHGRETW